MGQDWGNTDFDSEKTLENISKINLLSPNEYEKIQYLDGLKPFVTDKNLVELFASIGYPNIDKKRYSDLFFYEHFARISQNKCFSTHYKSRNFYR